MGVERRYKRQQARDVQKMYDKEMNKMAKMTEEQKVKYLQHLAERVYPDLEYADNNLNFIQQAKTIDELNK